MRDLDRFRGCLVGGAAGDALGYAVEFMTASEILSRYGPEGIQEYDLEDGLARISDDTQMTLFTAAGLLYGKTRMMNRGIGGPPQSYVRASYQDWLETQTVPYPGSKDACHCTWLMNVPELYARRAPGMTCLSALRAGGHGTLDRPVNSSKGCGGVMRAAPVGLYFCDRKIWIGESDKAAAETAAVTHGHELGWLPAAGLAHIVRLAAEQNFSVAQAVDNCIRAMPQIFYRCTHMDEFVAILEKAADLAGGSGSDMENIHSIGGGWTGEEALAIAVYCALRYSDDFDAALVASVNHSGDSDSTGSITGNILGAAIGYEALPEKYRTSLELLDVILEIADDLHHDCQISEYDDSDPVWVAKYITAEFRLH